MAIVNGSFEVGTGTPDGWAHVHVSSVFAIAAFDGLPWEAFEIGWGNDGFIRAFPSLGTEPATYETALALDKHVEDFEEKWSSNEDYTFDIVLAEAASFDVADPGAIEDFEDEWSSNEGYTFDLVTSESAGIDGFEIGWSNTGYLYEMSGTATASYDAVPEAFEDFEEEWPPMASAI